MNVTGPASLEISILFGQPHMADKRMTARRNPSAFITWL
jgi:hypothetical protein